MVRSAELAGTSLPGSGTLSKIASPTPYGKLVADITLDHYAEHGHKGSEKR